MTTVTYKLARLTDPDEVKLEAENETLARLSVGLDDRNGEVNRIEFQIVADHVWPAPDLPIEERWVGVCSHEFLHAVCVLLGEMDAAGDLDQYAMRGGKETARIEWTGLPAGPEGVWF